MKIHSDIGRTFNVRVILKGERYGLDDCLVHRDADPLIEFYDARYAGSKGFGPLGQHVTSYHASTLTDVTGGLMLNGGVPEWTVDAAAMRPVVEMAKALAR